MFCYKCGNSVSDEAVFCNKCGVKLFREEPMSQSPVAFKADAPAAFDQPAPTYADKSTLVSEAVSASRQAPHTPESSSGGDKKKRRLFILSGIAGVVIIVAVALALSMGGAEKSAAISSAPPQAISEAPAVASDAPVDQATATPLATKPIINARDVYKPIIDAYIALETSGFTNVDEALIGNSLLSTQKEGTYNFGWEELCPIAYSLFNINGDNTPELFIGGDTEYEISVGGIYTVVDNKPVSVLQVADRDYLAILTDQNNGFILECSNGHMGLAEERFYELNRDGQLVLLDKLTTEPDSEDEYSLRSREVDGKELVITEEEYTAIISKYGAYGYEADVDWGSTLYVDIDWARITSFYDEVPVITLTEAREIAQQWIDSHPLYERTIDGVSEEPTGNFGYDTEGLYFILLRNPEGESRVMQVHETTGEVFISPDGATLLSGEEFYTVMYANGTETAQNQYPQYEESAYAFDPQLVGGRWRTSDGKMLEFFEDGGINVSNITLFPDFESGYPIYTAVETDNGRLSIYGSQSYTFPYSLSQGGSGATFSYQGAEFVRPYGSNYSPDSLVGEWIPASNETMLYFIFYEDGTGKLGNDIVRTQLNYNYAERDGGQNFEWYGDGSDLTFTVKNEAHFDYLIQGDTLTLYTSDGTMYFTRIGGN